MGGEGEEHPIDPAVLEAWIRHRNLARVTSSHMNFGKAGYPCEPAALPGCSWPKHPADRTYTCGAHLAQIYQRARQMALVCPGVHMEQRARRVAAEGP